jgi:hypothetical protein
MAHTLRCTFLAQEWVGDTAYPIRLPNQVNATTFAETPPTWTCVVDTIPEPFSYGSDELRFMGDGAPQWAKEWDGPFEVDFELVLG